jgi:hypothetical protein
VAREGGHKHGSHQEHSNCSNVPVRFQCGFLSQSFGGFVDCTR